ncbi:MAG: ABC transporter ATP-binding protein [Beijerinckiaceae bacterium]
MSNESPSDDASGVAVLKRLVREHGRHHLPAYAGAAILMALAAAATAYSAYLLKPVVNGMVAGDSFRQLRTMAWIVAGLFAARGIVTYFSTLLLARTGNRIVASVQRRLFDHLLNQDMGFFNARHSTDFMTRLSYAAASVRDTLQTIVLSFSRDVLTLFGLVVVMFVHDPLLAMISLIVMPVAAVTLGKLVGKIRRSARRTYDGAGQIMQIMQETVLGSRIVKSFNLEPLMRKRMDESVRMVEKASNRVAASVALSGPVADTLAGMAIGAVIFYGSWRITVGGADPGSFFSFLGALLMAYDPAKRLARLRLDVQNGVTAAQMIYDILDRPAMETPKDGQPPLNLSSGRVVLEDVVFRYRPEEKVLDGFSFTAEPNQTSALVGPSGGGKSTIIALLQRFYSPESGSIYMDGQNIAEVGLHSLRSQIAFVSQDVFLFRGTIRENIAFGREDASNEDIVNAARQAYAHDFIMGFSQGYDTNVGESGAQLSGGQKQRIAIARAILKNAPIILLDEPTAALDSESERIVQQALDSLREGRTTIVVAHRLQTIVKADRIFVVENGRCVQSGNHAELMAQPGTYRNYFSSQFGEGVAPMAIRPAATQ